jgi:RNA polymerase sigma-70 factor (ECF subfamily)
MPPYAEWYRGREAVAAFLAEVPLAEGRRWRVEPATANGQPALAFNNWDEQIGAFLTHGLSVLTFGAGGITAFTTFLDPSVVR